MHPTHHPPIHRTDASAPALILRDAAWYLTRHGWTQGLMYTDPARPTPAACAVGAIKMAVCGDPLADLTGDHADDYEAALEAFAGHLDRVFYVWGVTDLGDPAAPADVIADWNDHRDRTADQVIAALRAAADACDETHGGAS
jgi:hypothetical protein